MQCEAFQEELAELRERSEKKLLREALRSTLFDDQQIDRQDGEDEKLGVG